MKLQRGFANIVDPLAILRPAAERFKLSLVFSRGRWVIRHDNEPLAFAKGRYDALLILRAAIIAAARVESEFLHEQVEALKREAA